MSDFKGKLNNFFFLEDEESSDIKENKKDPVKRPKKECEYYNREDHLLKKSGGENVVAINQKQLIKKPRIIILEPRLYSEVQEVSDVLLEKQSVVINLRRMENEQATKMINFLMGVTYAIKGDIRRLGEQIFVCTPQNIDVSGSEFAESLL